MVRRMGKLYLLAVDGRMFYFTGDVPQKKYDWIEQIVNRIELKDGENKYTDFVTCFLNEVNNELGIHLYRLKGEYVFRKTQDV